MERRHGPLFFNKVANEVFRFEARSRRNQQDLEEMGGFRTISLSRVRAGKSPQRISVLPIEYLPLDAMFNVRGHKWEKLTVLERHIS